MEPLQRTRSFLLLLALMVLCITLTGYEHLLLQRTQSRRSEDSWRRRTGQDCDPLLSLRHRRSSRADDQCSATSLNSSLTSAYLAQAAKHRGRPSHVVFIGDSRSRIVFQRLRRDLQLQDVLCQPRDHRNESGVSTEPRDTGPGQTEFPCPVAKPDWLPFPDLCLESFGAVQPARPDNLHCSMQAYNAHVYAEFWWNIFIDAAYAERLRLLSQQCVSTRRCPDLVVLSSGMWYVARTRADRPFGRLQATLQFRSQLRALEPPIATLATFSRVLWKLEEPAMELLGRIRPFEQAAFNVMHALLHETQTRVPDLEIWSSMLPEINDILHNVCLHLDKKSDVSKECSEFNHVGQTIRSRYSTYVINLLYQDTPASRTNSSCCEGRKQPLLSHAGGLRLVGFCLVSGLLFGLIFMIRTAWLRVAGVDGRYIGLPYQRSSE